MQGGSGKTGGEASGHGPRHTTGCPSALTERAESRPWLAPRCSPQAPSPPWVTCAARPKPGRRCPPRSPGSAGCSRHLQCGRAAQQGRYGRGTAEQGGTKRGVCGCWMQGTSCAGGAGWWPSHTTAPPAARPPVVRWVSMAATMPPGAGHSTSRNLMPTWQRWVQGRGGRGAVNGRGQQGDSARQGAAPGSGPGPACSSGRFRVGARW